jgi:hypothetical protein
LFSKISSDNKFFLDSLTHLNISLIFTQIKASGNNQTFEKAENLHPIQSGKSKTSYHSDKHCFLKLELSQAIIVKCFSNFNFSFLIKSLKNIKCDIVSSVEPDLEITKNIVLLKSIKLIIESISTGSTLSIIYNLGFQSLFSLESSL